MDAAEGPPPDPAEARDLGEFIEALGRLRVWAGSPPYRTLAKTVGSGLRPPQVLAHTTIGDLFQTRRRRLDLDLVTATVRALGLAEPAVAQWRAACVRVQVQERGGGPTGVFRQLPADLATFTGRAQELQALFAAIDRDPGSSPTVVVSAIEGMAGIGKTRLAVRAAHELVRAGRYKDVQLFVNLRGFDPDHPPADPAVVLDGFLRQLGVPAQAIPESREDRSAMFRDRLHDQDALIVLDNAADENQVRDLIPANPSCLVLITSRRSLTGLADAVLCQLGLFREDEASALLALIVGEARVAAEPQAAAAIVRLCGRLPLAVALAGGQLRRRPTWRLAELVDRLESTGLDALGSSGAGRAAGVGGADKQGVRSLFDLSVRALPRAAQRVYCWATLFPGSSFTAAAMAAAAGLSPAEAESILEGLVDEYLLDHRTAGRYELHDLLLLFAAEFAETVDGGVSVDERQAAENRLGAYYLAATAAAMDALYPQQKQQTIEIPQPATPPPAFIGADDTQSWLDAEHRNIIGLALLGVADPVPMSILLWQYLEDTSRLADALHLHTAALAMVPADEAQRRAQILNQLGIAHDCLGHFDEALAVLEEAAVICGEIGYLRGESITLQNIAVLHFDHGNMAAALEVSQRALAMTRDLGDGWRNGDLLTNIGGILVQLGRSAEAIDVLGEAIAVAQENDNHNAHAAAVGNLGQAYFRRGDFQRALTVLTEALELSRQVKRRHSEGENLVLLGRVHAGSGDPELGLTMIEQGLEIGKENGPHYEAAALIALADTYRQIGDIDRAHDHYQTARTIIDRYRIHPDSPLRKDLEAGIEAVRAR
ncbi:tetratricopeptide repeat protein [Catenulispora sp. GP43]|uniref:tetratricopeptide repeat protein n=1 Tax=Catenulispora sp. GP43 TaxID=3156263 RepID=UPI0035164DB3